MEKFDNNLIAFQSVIHMIASNSNKPLIWNTQRQVGKSTLLAKLCAEYLQHGDVWSVSHTHKVAQNFQDAVIKEIPVEHRIRTTRSKIELATPVRTNTFGDPRAFYKIDSGLSTEYRQPVLIVMDECQFLTLPMIHDLLQYIKNPKETKLIATCTGLNREVVDYIDQQFGESEVITVLIDSKNQKSPDKIHNKITK